MEGMGGGNVLPWKSQRCRQRLGGSCPGESMVQKGPFPVSKEH